MFLIWDNIFIVIFLIYEHKVSELGQIFSYLLIVSNQKNVPELGQVLIFRI